MTPLEQIAQMAAATGGDAFADDSAVSVFHRDDLAGRKISFQRGHARHQQAGVAFDQRFAGVGVDRYLSVYGGSEGQPALFAGNARTRQKNRSGLVAPKNPVENPRRFAVGDDHQPAGFHADFGGVEFGRHASAPHRRDAGNQAANRRSNFRDHGNDARVFAARVFEQAIDI